MAVAVRGVRGVRRLTNRGWYQLLGRARVRASVRRSAGRTVRRTRVAVRERGRRSVHVPPVHRAARGRLSPREMQGGGDRPTDRDGSE